MLKLFKIIAFLEGTSLLLLLFFAVPMKYFFQEPIFVKILGMAHGILFVVYIILAIIAKIELNWSFKKMGVICIASIVPFGTFYVEKKYLK
jgi:integral membrane protein